MYTELMVDPLIVRLSISQSLIFFVEVLSEMIFSLTKMVLATLPCFSCVESSLLLVLGKT
jgi:hypothetical protein